MESLYDDGWDQLPQNNILEANHAFVSDSCLVNCASNRKV